MAGIYAADGSQNVTVVGGSTGGSASQIQGTAAGNDPAVGNPVQVGAINETTLSTYANGDVVPLHAGTRGSLHVTIMDANATSAATVVTPSSDGAANATGIAVGRSQNAVFNGSTWDRMRSAGSNLGVLVENGPYLGSRLIAEGQVKGSAGFIHTITISPLTATPTAGLLTVYNSLTETGTVVYSEWVFATDTGHTVTLDIPCSTGIYVGFDGTLANVSVTVSYR